MAEIRTFLLIFGVYHIGVGVDRAIPGPEAPYWVPLTIGLAVTLLSIAITRPRGEH